MADGNSSRPVPPKFTRLTGEALWNSILNRYELEQHELLLLREIVRSVDDLDRLANISGKQGAITAAGGVHPAIAEARQMRMALATLIGALRLPDENEEEPVSVRRPRRYANVRSIDQPARQTRSPGAEALYDGTSALQDLPAASGRKTASRPAQNPRGNLDSARPAARPVRRQFKPAPTTRPPAAQSQQITVTELLAKVAQERNTRNQPS